MVDQVKSMHGDYARIDGKLSEITGWIDTTDEKFTDMNGDVSSIYGNPSLLNGCDENGHNHCDKSPPSRRAGSASPRCA